MYNNYFQDQYKNINSYNPYQIPRYPTYQGNEQYVNYNSQQNMIQGKIVDSIETAKATDTPLNGSTIFMPLSDGSMIITKQLVQDGTCKMVVYKPIDNADAEVKKPNYLTQSDLDEAIKKIDNKDIIQDIRTMKKQIKDIAEDLEEIRDRKD